MSISAVYEFDHELDLTSRESFYAPLRRCIEEHPFLTVVVADGHTNKPFYQRVPNIDLQDHITILGRARWLDQWRDIEEVLQGQIDLPFHDGIPPWRIVVLPLAQKPSSCLVAFVYSHTILDGPSGVAFHRTFLAAAKSVEPGSSTSPIVATPSAPLPPPFDTADKLPISWGFLLEPLLAVLVPRFLVNWLGLKAQSSNLTDSGSWTGTPCRFAPGKKLLLGVIPGPLMDKALDQARANGARLTGFLHVLILRTLSKALANQHKFINFVSQTPINMRRAGGRPRDEMGEFASVVEIAHPRPDPSVRNGPVTEDEWALAREAGERFADAASRLRDQPIGLLRYVPNMRKWLLGKIGQRREASYELSNVGAFEDEDSQRGHVRIKDMVFAQPGMVAGAPICFNVISVKGGSLVYSMTWIVGSLGLEREEDEEGFVDGLRKSIREEFEAAVRG